MKKLLLAVIVIAAIAVAVSMTSGCATGDGPYFQQTRQNKPHCQQGRIYNPGDYRYEHERHAEGIESHVSD